MWGGLQPPIYDNKWWAKAHPTRTIKKHHEKQPLFFREVLDGAEVESRKPLRHILIRTKGTKITAAEMKVLPQDNTP